MNQKLVYLENFRHLRRKPQWYDTFEMDFDRMTCRSQRQAFYLYVLRQLSNTEALLFFSIVNTLARTQTVSPVVEECVDTHRSKAGFYTLARHFINLFSAWARLKASPPAPEYKQVFDTLEDINIAVIAFSGGICLHKARRTNYMMKTIKENAYIGQVN